MFEKIKSFFSGLMDADFSHLPVETFSAMGGFGGLPGVIAQDETESGVTPDDVTPERTSKVPKVEEPKFTKTQ